MNKKIIGKIIKKKMNQWLATIDDLDLSSQIEKDVIVTGGCVASMLMNEDVNDFDVYFKTKATTKRVAEYYCSKFNSKHSGTNARVLDGAEATEEEKNLRFSATLRLTCLADHSRRLLWTAAAKDNTLGTEGATAKAIQPTNGE